MAQEGGGAQLSPDHWKYLRDAAVDPDVFPAVRSLSGGIEFTLEGVTGRRITQFRPDKPRGEAKYITEAGGELVMPVPVGMRALVMDTTVPLLIVEGTKGAAAAASALLRDGHPDPIAVVGLLGCWGWSKDSVPITDLVSLPMEGREVVVLLDADFTTNRNVWDAAKALGDVCRMMLNARRVRWAQVPGTRSQSVDDMLSVLPFQMRSGAVRRMVAAASDKLPRQPAKRKDGPFPDGYSATAAAELLLDSGKFAPMALSSDGTIAVYRDGQYHNGYSAMFEDMTQRLLGSEYTKTRLKDVESVVATQLAIRDRRIPEFQERLLIPFRNGLLDPVDGTLYDHDPDFLTMRRFQVDWRPDAEAPFYLEWLSRQIAHPEAVPDFEEVVSQMFDMRRTPVKGMLLFGPSRSGKGTVTRLIEAMVGPENSAAVSLHKLATNAFASADLLGKTINVYADLSPQEVSDISTLKLALGDDLIRAERKHGQPFMFRNTALMIFAANEVPPVSESSQAYFNRIKPYEFPNTYAGAEDPLVAQRLMDELEGIAVRWVAALVRRLERGSFLPTHPETDRKFRMKSDRVAEYVWEHYVRDPEALTSREDLYTGYKLWAADNNQGVLGRNRFLDRVRNLGVEEVKTARARGFRLLEKAGGEAAVPAGPGAVVIPSGGSRSQMTGSGEDHSGSRSQTSTNTHESGQMTGPVAVMAGSDPLSPLGIQPSSLVSESPIGEVSSKLPQLPLAPPDPSLANEGDSVRDLADETLSDGFLFMDLETGSADALHSTSEGFIRVVGTQGQVDADPGRVVSAVASGVPLVAHNGFNFDFVALAKHAGLDYLAAGDAGLLWDSKVAAILGDPPTARLKSPERYYSLDSWATRLGFPGKTADVKRMAREYGGYECIPFDVLAPYCAGDVEAMRSAFGTLPTSDPYYLREMRLMARLGYALRVRGWRVDEELVARRVAGVEAALARGRETLARYGFPADSARPQATKAGKAALRAFLEDAGMEIQPWMLTNSGDVSTGKDVWGPVLEHPDTVLPDSVREVLETVLALSGARTVFHTVQENTVGGRVYPSIMPTQASGRFSIQKPGITVMGKRGGKFTEREVYLPDPGEVLVSFDLNQVDARAVAMHSQDRGYMALFQDPSIDSHAEIARMVWGDPSRRNEAKALGHGWNYGMSVSSLAEQAGIPLSTAQEFDARMRAQFPRLVEWQGEVREMSRAGVLLDNGYGRKMRPVPDRAHTQAPALMGQGLARDLLMEGLLRLPLEAVECLRGSVHDELVFSVPADGVDEFVSTVLDAIQFERAGVPVTAGLVGVGNNWGEVYVND